MKKSHMIPLNRFIGFIKRISGIFNEDRVTVYSAQASFFIIISSIPFIILLIYTGQYIVPHASEYIIDAVRSILPAEISHMIDWEAQEVPRNFTLLSISAPAALWSASKGIGAVFRGVKCVYGTGANGNFIKHIVQNFLYTIVFIAVILASVILLIFGSTIRDITAADLPALSTLTDKILQNQGIIFFIFLTIFFRLIYSTAAKGSAYKNHIAGAAAASTGWMLFSYFYSLYIRYFSNAQGIYGSLTSVVLMMLWLYFCMIILLSGAEVNKLIAGYCKNEAAAVPPSAASSGRKKK